MTSVAPVYRGIDATNTLLGLAFPSEVVLVLGVYWVSILATTPGIALLCTFAAYAGLRLSTLGKPTQHLLHLALFHVRRAPAQGRLSAAARDGRSPRFPHAALLCRDVPRANP